MINELYQFIHVLEKLNTRIGIEVVTKQEVAETRDTILRIQNNQKNLMDIIQNGMDPDADIEKILTQMYECLENIVQDLDDFHALNFLAMTRNREYNDEKEGTKG